MATSEDVVNLCLDNKPVAVFKAVNEIMRSKVAEILQQERERISAEIFNGQK